MARNSHTAYGSAKRTPDQPLGRKGPFPSGMRAPPGPTFIAIRPKSMCIKALIQNTNTQASASSVTTTVMRNDISTPTIFNPTKIR